MVKGIFDCYVKCLDESFYHVPIIVEPKKCLDAVRTGYFNLDGKDHKVGINKVSLDSYYSHGSIKYSGTNIECQGRKE